MNDTFLMGKASSLVVSGYGHLRCGMDFGGNQQGIQVSRYSFLISQEAGFGSAGVLTADASKFTVVDGPEQHGGSRQRQLVLSGSAHID
jgi:hypothetical protein